MNQISGEHALPQPEDILDPTGRRIATLPEPVLRREAIMRSCRWIYAILAGLIVVGTSRSIFSIVFSTGVTVGKESLTWLVPMLIQTTLHVLVSVAMYWALSTPRRVSRLIIGVALGYSVLILVAQLTMWNLRNLPGIPGISSVAYYWPIVNQLPELILALVLIVVSETGAGRILYSEEGVAYFSQPSAERKDEMYWIPVAYTVLTVIRWVIPIYLFRR